jgi:peptide deformylase
VSDTEAKGQVVEQERDPEREARRRLALAQVRQYPDPVLRMRANEVEEFDDGLRTLVERMTALMHEASGVGLAAPQIGILRRVLVYQAGEEEELVALVNPEIAESSDETEVAEEGCLSLGAASVVVEVERPLTVTVEATDPDGEPVRIEAEGLAARVVQHEIDHLDGVLILQRTTPEQRREALSKLRPQPVLGPLA